MKLYIKVNQSTIKFNIPKDVILNKILQESEYLKQTFDDDVG